MYSAYKLNKQGHNIQPWRTPFPIWKQSVVPCPVLIVASWLAYRLLKRQVRGSGIPIYLRIFHSLLWSRVKGFDIVNKAEKNVFLELSCFFKDQADVGNLISGSSAFSKTSLNIWKFTVHILLKPGLKNFEHYFTSVWDECNRAVVQAFFCIAFLWDWNENWPFPVLWLLLSFPNLLAYWVQHFHGIISQAERSNPTSKEQWLCRHRRAERSYSTFKVRRGSREWIPLVQGKEQQLRFAGLAVKRYPTPKVRETQVKTVGVARGHQRADTLKP